MARGVMNYVDSLEKSVDDIPSTVFEDSRSHWNNRFKEIKKMNGSENPHKLHQELGDIMLANVLIVRDNESLEKATQAISDIEIRFKDLKSPDTPHRAFLLDWNLLVFLLTALKPSVQTAINFE